MDKIVALEKEVVMLKRKVKANSTRGVHQILERANSILNNPKQTRKQEMLQLVTQKFIQEFEAIESEEDSASQMLKDSDSLDLTNCSSPENTSDLGKREELPFETDYLELEERSQHSWFSENIQFALEEEDLFN